MNPMKIPTVKIRKKIYLCACISLLTFPAASIAAEVNLSWLPNSESQLDGYVIHYGSTSGNYTESIDVGNPSTVNGEVISSVAGLNEGDTYYFALTAYDNNGTHSPLSDELMWTAPIEPQPSPDPVAIIDNGDSESSQTGTWKTSLGPGYYGSISEFTNEADATYSYETTLDGRQEMALRWTYYQNRCTDVPVLIYDGSMLLDTVTVNQKENGGEWNVLGTYNFTSGTGKVVITSKGNSCTTSADAVRFTGKTTTLEYTTIEGPAQVLSNSETDFNAWAHYNDGSKENVEPEWSIDCSSMAEVTDTGMLKSINIYQDITCTLTASYEENGVIASTEKDVTVQYVAPAIEEIILDNGDDATLAEGEWKPSSGSNSYETKSVYTWVKNARYTFEAEVNGPQELSLWWTYHNTRCTSVPVDIYDDMTLIDTVWINQKNNAGKWNVLGSYEFPSGTAAVVINAIDSSCSTNADGVRFKTSN